MNIKLIVTKTNEQLIAKVEEMMVDDRVVGYFFYKPCVMLIEDPIFEKNTNKTSFGIKLSPWIPFGKTSKVPISLDWVVTFVDPVEDLRLMYEEQILGINKDEKSPILKVDCEDC
jgi:hypothetical protein